MNAPVTKVKAASNGTMGDWKARKMSKGQRGSQSTGRSKGITASALARTFCRRNRSYKNPLYEQVMSKLGQRGPKGK